MFNYDEVLDDNYNLDELVKRIISCEDKGEFMFLMKEFNSEVLCKENNEKNQIKENNYENNDSFSKTPSLHSILKNKNRINFFILEDLSLLDTGFKEKFFNF